MNWRAPTFAAIALTLSLATVARAEGETPEQMAQEVLQLLNEAREDAGVERLESREALTAVAVGRARLVASLPHERRLRVRRSIGEDIKAAAAGPFLRVKLHLDMNRGSRYPASSFFNNWKRNATWSTAMEPDFDALGMGVARGADGWMILAAVFLQDVPVPEDLPALESDTIALINAAREEKGLSQLIQRDWLSEVARRHSQDMADRDYVAHRSPDGTRPADRVKAAGGRYRKVAENIYMSSGLQDPARTAADAWMGSRGHRRTILTPGFVETGMGIVVDELGRIYFTQLFYTPAE